MGSSGIKAPQDAPQVIEGSPGNCLHVKGEFTGGYPLVMSK
jgi:hypothetical protein